MKHYKDSINRAIPVFEYSNYSLNLHYKCSSGIEDVRKTLTFKRTIQWLTELQKTAQHADHAWQSALLAQFQKVTSTRSTLTYASTVVHVQTLAQWVQSYQSNRRTAKRKRPGSHFPDVFFLLCQPLFCRSRHNLYQIVLFKDCLKHSLDVFSGHRIDSSLVLGIGIDSEIVPVVECAHPV